MPLTPASAEPIQLVVGVAWEWDAHYADTPPSEGYTLTYDFAGVSTVPTVAATTSPDGDYYEVREAAADTAGLDAGTYLLVGQVTKGAEVQEVYRAMVTLLADVPVTGDVGKPTQDEREARALEAASLQLAAHGFARVTVNGRTVEYREMSAVHQRLGRLYARIRMSRHGGRFQRRKLHFPAAS